jgi:DHA2 family multidrug resistance protein-like MFS transporter
MLGTARLTGQAVGAALVALILGRLGLAGATVALYAGATAAALGALVSLTRLRMFDKPGAAA